ncbi:RNA polymerase subunit sigma [Streptomyces sp. WAC 04229]|uniref:sigma-70 family RNA polymerase sigma factor n=1 Tax=Streptomyces sp. WAC 04229 TaxID=2203206 RepID=UPI000F73EAE3|nr:sigma-70 family RNA polymerase sigma factor [Streptomyces sp. WAC 04229]RSN59792.1 RNA polymerase subunit sigma [Streptomyces sp. WAC 04229]
MISPAPSAVHDRTAPAARARQERTSADESATFWALAARGGDPRAVENLVRALQRDVRRFVTHLGADPQSADDLAQDTFLRALGSLHRFEGRSSARTWLLAIARRAVIDSHRYASARPRLLATEDWETAAECAQEHGLPGFDDGIALAGLLDALPHDRREAFVITQLVGVSYAEAAELIGCPVGTVRSRVARAREALIRALGEAERSGPPDAQRAIRARTACR